MAARLSAKKLPRYSLEFKRMAVSPTQVPGMEVQAVAKGPDLHPVMLSRWRQEARLGRLRGRAEEPPPPKKLVRRPESKRVQLAKVRAALEEQEGVPPGVFAGGMDWATASQLIRGVRPKVAGGAR